MPATAVASASSSRTTSSSPPPAGNVGFGPAVAGRPKAEIRERVGELLHLVGLDGPRAPGRRVAVRREAASRRRWPALAPEPRLLLLDEPLGARSGAPRPAGRRPPAPAASSGRPGCTSPTTVMRPRGGRSHRHRGRAPRALIARRFRSATGRTLASVGTVDELRAARGAPRHDADAPAPARQAWTAQRSTSFPASRVTGRGSVPRPLVRSRPCARRATSWLQWPAISAGRRRGSTRRRVISSAPPGRSSRRWASRWDTWATTRAPRLLGRSTARSTSGFLPDRCRRTRPSGVRSSRHRPPAAADCARRRRRPRRPGAAGRSSRCVPHRRRRLTTWSCGRITAAVDGGRRTTRQ